MQELDKLDEKLEEVRNVCRIVKKLKARCDAAGGRMDQLALQRFGASGVVRR